MDAIAGQRAHIAILTEHLQRAEQAAARAVNSAADAHRRADDLLLQLEAAETDLHGLLGDTAPAAGNVALPRRRRLTLTGQTALFDIA